MKWTALHIAAKKGHKEICEFIIDNSDEKNPSDQSGMTPLHFAAERGLANVCKLIIENIVDTNPAALNGCTPLHLAAKEGHLEIIRLIVETGVDKNTLYNGVTPLWSFARPFKSFTFYKLLCKDKFHLCGMILLDLLMCFVMCFVIFACLFTVVALILEIFCHFGRHDDVSLYVLITFVIAFPLTIMIRVWLWFH